MQHSGTGLRFIAYNNDGWKDLLVSLGHVVDAVDIVNPNLHYREPMLLARNTGKAFMDVSPMSSEIFHEAWAGRGSPLRTSIMTASWMRWYRRARVLPT